MKRYDPGYRCLPAQALPSRALAPLKKLLRRLRRASARRAAVLPRFRLRRTSSSSSGAMLAPAPVASFEAAALRAARRRRSVLPPREKPPISARVRPARPCHRAPRPALQAVRAEARLPPRRRDDLAVVAAERCVCVRGVEGGPDPAARADLREYHFSCRGSPSPPQPTNPYISGIPVTRESRPSAAGIGASGSHLGRLGDDISSPRAWMPRDETRQRRRCRPGRCTPVDRQRERS